MKISTLTHIIYELLWYKYYNNYGLCLVLTNGLHLPHVVDDVPDEHRWLIINSAHDILC